MDEAVSHALAAGDQEFAADLLATVAMDKVRSGRVADTARAIEMLPDSLPAFVRTPEAAVEIAVMGRELDRSKGSGKTHDAELDPGHYVDLADDGAVMGVLPLAQLPMTREEYDTLLRAKGFTQYKAGYLPYSIVQGWQQVRKDFAYWRALTKGIETAAPPEERAWFEADRRLREMLTLLV